MPVKERPSWTAPARLSPLGGFCSRDSPSSVTSAAAKAGKEAFNRAAHFSAAERSGSVPENARPRVRGGRSTSFHRDRKSTQESARWRFPFRGFAGFHGLFSRGPTCLPRNQTCWIRPPEPQQRLRIREQDRSHGRGMGLHGRTGHFFRALWKPQRVLLQVQAGPFQQGQQRHTAGRKSVLLSGGDLIEQSDRLLPWCGKGSRVQRLGGIRARGLGYRGIEANGDYRGLEGREVQLGQGSAQAALDLGGGVFMRHPQASLQAAQAQRGQQQQGNEQERISPKRKPRPPRLELFEAKPWHGQSIPKSEPGLSWFCHGRRQAAQNFPDCACIHFTDLQHEGWGR